MVRATTFSGINEIIRFSINGFLQKMDDPEFQLFVTDKNKSYNLVNGDKIYYLNLIMQMKSEETTHYERFRLTLNRSGIIQMEKLPV